MRPAVQCKLSSLLGDDPASQDPGHALVHGCLGSHAWLVVLCTGAGRKGVSIPCWRLSACPELQHNLAEYAFAESHHARTPTLAQVTKRSPSRLNLDGGAGQTMISFRQDAAVCSVCAASAQTLSLQLHRCMGKSMGCCLPSQRIPPSPPTRDLLYLGKGSIMALEQEFVLNPKNKFGRPPVSNFNSQHFNIVSPIQLVMMEGHRILKGVLFSLGVKYVLQTNCLRTQQGAH
eukprot:1159102-Pelagomonas_calceolata.AAC.6